MTDIKQQFLPSHLANDLYSSTSSSPQPNALIRTALFTPKAKKRVGIDHERLDVTDAFREITYFSTEGYDSATIHGPSLNVQIDFRIWCGVVLAFSKYGLKSNRIGLKFTEFAAMCGYSSKRFNKGLRQQIEKSLDRIQDQKIRLRKTDSSKFLATGLLLKASYEVEKDLVVLLADENLWEIYALDHQVLIRLNVLSNLPHSEVAQCLYLFFASLPQNPLPVSYDRMQKRLQLNMKPKEVNRSIRNAIKKLEVIGYLEGVWVKFHDQSAYKITFRDKKLIL